MTRSMPVRALVASWSDPHFPHFKGRLGINHHIGGNFETSNHFQAGDGVTGGCGSA